MGRPKKDIDEKRGSTLTFKVTTAEHDLIAALAQHRAEELLRLTGQRFDVPVSSYLRWLIDTDAAKRGLGVTPAPVTEAPVVAPVAVEKAAPKPKATTAKTAKPKAVEPAVTPESVRAAVLAAVEKGSTRADIVKAAGVDQGQFSAFMSEKKGFSPAKLEDVFRAARKLSA